MAPPQVAALPDFFIALVLQNSSREPTKQEYEELREQTITFWTKRLKKVYNPKFNFETLNLKFEKTVVGPAAIKANDTENHNLDADFNIFVEVSGDASFAPGHTKSAPSGDEVFREMVAGDSMNYLTGHVRKANKENLFSTAIEVCVRRLRELADGSAGGTVIAPSFFVAFSTDGTYDKPPTEKQIAAYKKRTHALIDENLKKEYPNSYVSSDLTVLTSELGANKPSEKFQLYLENDLAATFSSGPLPTPNELFAIVMRCASIDSNRYMTTMFEIEDSVFETITLVTIQLIGLELPDDPEEPKDEDKEEESGDEGSQQGEQDDVEEEVITYNVPIFLALVVNAQPPAKMPSMAELGEFQDLMQRFFYSVLKKEYPKSIIDLKLVEKTTQYDAGFPEERFNMCTEYDATIRFKKREDTPEEKKLRGLIVNCNLSSILAHVQSLKPLCFQGASEVSMRQKSEKQEADPTIADPTFEAEIDPPPMPKKVEPPKPPAKPKKVEPPPKPKKVEPPKPPPEPKKVEPPKPPPEPKKVEPPKPAPKPKKVESPPKPVEKKAPKDFKKVKPKQAETKKEPKPKVSKEEPKQRLSLNIPSPKKEPKPPGQLVESSDVYVALTIQDLDTPLTDEHYEKLRIQTHKFFSKRLAEVFPTMFLSMDLEIGLKEFGKAKPNPKYNVYVEWVIQGRFKSESSSEPARTVEGKRGSITVKDNSGLPGPVQLTQAIVKDIDLIDYLVNYCQALGPPFDMVMGGFIQQRIAGVN